MGTKKLRTYAHNLVRHSCVCRYCHTRFQASRPDAEFCCSKHRQADYRHRRKAEREAERTADLARRAAADREAVAKLRRRLDDQAGDSKTGRPQ